MFAPLSKDAYFIELLYRNKSPQESVLDFGLDHIRINLCLPYILKLYQMAMEAIGSNKKQESEVAKVDSAPAEKKNQPETTASTLKVDAKINLPEIVLFAQPEKTNSKILFMNVSRLC